MCFGALAARIAGKNVATCGSWGIMLVGSLP